MIKVILASLLVAALPVSGATAQTRPAGAAVKLVSVSTGAMAPATVLVSALGITPRAGTQLTARYEWNFGDPGSSYNRLVGWNAAHTYDRPGSYTIRLTLTDESGARSEYTEQVTIQADARPTMYVSSAGDDRNPGTSPDKPKRTLLRALTNADAAGARILLRRGQTFELPTALKPRGRNLIIGAYGESSTVLFGLPAVASIAMPEDRPRVVWTGPRVPYGMIESWVSDLLIQDIAFDSVYSRDTEKRDMPTAILPRGVNTTVRRCTFYNVGDGINGNQRPVGVLMQDCAAPSIVGLRSYLAWVEGTDQVYIGNLAFNSTREAVFRVGNSGGQRILIAQNTFANLDRTTVDRVDTAKNALTVQFGSDIYIAGNTLMIGPVIVGPLGNKDGLPQKTWRLRRVVVEDNRIARSQLRIAHGTIGLVARNNRLWANDRTAINVEGFNQEYQRGSADITIAHNTAHNQGSLGNFLRAGGRVDGISVINNLYSAPNLSPGSHEAAVAYVGQSDLSGYRAVQGNVWPVCKPQEYARGGSFYVWPSWSDERGYRTLSAWLGLPPVRDEIQTDVKLDDALRPARMPAEWRRPRAALVDTFGQPRDAERASPGAVEVGSEIR
jgi:PKD repeat protein